jgi:hypothetical protein
VSTTQVTGTPVYSTSGGQGNTVTATVSCPAGKYALGGGGEVTSPASGGSAVGRFALTVSKAVAGSPEGWRVSATNLVSGNTTDTVGLVAYVVCSA